MKKLIVLFFLMTCTVILTAQDKLIEEGRRQIDSLIQKIDGEPDPAKRLNLVLAIYSTPIEAFPVLMFETYKKMYQLGEKNNDYVASSSAWSIAGQGYRLVGNYIKALDCHHKAVEQAEKSGDPLLLGYAQNQMAHIYKDREENEKAISLYKTAAENISKGNNELLKMWPRMNLGAVLLKLNQPDSALFYSTQAYQIMVKYKLDPYMDYVMSSIGSAYSLKGDSSKARAYFLQAIDAAIKSGSPRFLNNTYISIAEHFQRFKEEDSVIYYAKKAIEAVQNTNLSNLVLKPARMLTDIYEKTNPDSTYRYLKLYTVANDSLYSTRANQQLRMMTFEEDLRQRDIEDEELKYKNRVRTNLLIAGLLVFLLIAFILYRNNRQKQKTNQVLASTLENLQTTQAQLIQSEKMASLGELTAGIAHEIQNPLNFVNNFSEINQELLQEMKDELDKGNYSEAKNIAADISENESKINHHGKRADSIVKGMLQHSRSSSPVKEASDINKLADEYLRLAYHGLRAKDKSFNATLETAFDEKIGTIQIIPQDIGRVILNLITNAFYAVTERLAKEKAAGNTAYQPTVSMSTKKLDGKVLISVTDNGNGIPQSIINKIFQPFFTTKPTGQGTGLGLSMSYDIITKAHGGELKVDSSQAGTTFSVILPNTI